VLVQFVVSKEGKVKDVKVVRSSGSELLDNEAVRAISISPDWTPGKVKGEPVHVSYMFPVVFKYNPDDPKTSEENGNEPIPFDDVEVKPTFQGKDPNAEFSKWMAGEMKYPEEASKNKIMGRVLIQFVISRDGKVKDVKVARSSGSDLLDKEAVRVISASPDWDPGKMEGKPVDVRYLFPVVFIIR
jgi:TonB family protein